MKSGHNLAGILSSVFGDYLNMKADAFRKRVVTGLSEGFAMVLALLVILMVLMIALVVLSFGFFMLVADAIGNWTAAAFIVGGIFLVIVLVLFLLRKRLFVSMFENIFSTIADKENGSDEIRPMLLTLVRYLRCQIK